MHRTSVLVLGILSLFAFFAVVAIASVDDPKSDRHAAAVPSDPALAPAASAQPLPALPVPNLELASRSVQHHAVLDGGAIALAKPSAMRSRSAPAVWKRTGKGHTFMKPPFNRHAGKRKVAAPKKPGAKKPARHGAKKH